MNRKEILNKCFGYAGQRAKLGDAVEALETSVSAIKGTQTGQAGATAPAEDVPSLASLASSLSELSATVSALAALATCTITFDADGGSSVSALTVPYNTVATAPTPPTKSEYTFAGWLLGGTAFDWTAPVTQNLTLTASWTAAE